MEKAIKKIEELLDIYYEEDGMKDYYREVAIKEYENGMSLEDLELLMMEAEL